MLEIRKYRPRRDKPAVRELLAELLDSERAAEPEWPAAQEIIEPYFKWMIQRCRDYSGEILVAEENGKIMGFVTVLGRIMPADPDEYHKEFALISELIVHGPYRGRGLGRQLISAAEEYACQNGVSSIRLEASAGNTRGRQFYTKAGYREMVIEYFKKLS
jgi:ribosomal protein S18 acetylase RimI-like enzyme